MSQQQQQQQRKNSTVIIIDVQGFQFGKSDFICREIAMISTKNGNYEHTLVSFPFDIDWLNSRIISHLQWLKTNLHGLEWKDNDDDDWQTTIKYEDLVSYIKTFINNNGDNDCILAVKGVQKVEWLSNLLKREVINLEKEEEEDMPKLDYLKNIFKSYHCNQHAINTLSCSLENVYNLYHWHKYCKK